MSQILKKYIGSNQIGAGQLLIEKNAAVRGTDSTDTVVDLLKLNTSDEVLLKGISILNAAGMVPSEILPSYVDDVIEAADYASLPQAGEVGKIYVTLDNNKCFRWSGSTYVQITSGAVDSVNGKSGVVVLDTGDIAEGGNLYFTDARAQAALSADLALKLDASEVGVSVAELVDGKVPSAQLPALSTSDVSEGTNLYFTDARAKAAAVADSITAGVTDVAPSQAAVKTALNAKQDAIQFKKMKVVLDGLNISERQVSIDEFPIAGSMMIFVGRLAMHEDTDYYLTEGGGQTFINFDGDMLPDSGVSGLEEGDELYVTYAVKL